MSASPLVPAPRSNFVTALAWVFIVLSGFATFIALMQNLMVQFLMPGFETMPPPRNGQAVPPWALFVMHNLRWIFLFFFLVCASTLTASIGLLRRRNWARIAFIAVMAFGVIWNIGGLVVMAWVFSTMPPIPRPPGFDGHFDVFMVMMAFNVLMTLAISALFAWIIKRLMSSDIRREFGAAD